MALELDTGNTLRHPGLPGGSIDGYPKADLGDLVDSGLLRVTDTGPGVQMFDLRQEAFNRYNREHRSSVEPVEAHVSIIREYVSAESVVARYREAFAKWNAADSLLWQDDSVENLTTIGHLCREALQLFVARLIDIHNLEGAEPDPAKTINRLRSVVDTRKAAIGNRNADLLRALIEYWGAVNGIVQRQEHGETKAGGELTWDDGRRVLLYTAMVMSECDRILS